MNLQKFNIFIVSIILSVLTACATNPVTGKKEFMLLSEKQEIAMGQQSDPEIIQYFGIYEDDKLQKFIQRTGERMARVSHRPDLNYEFKIVDSPVVNAFAVPGGYVYFTRGIMAHFNNEAEFAGVLGHELGHITARHSAQQYSNTMLAQVGLAAGMIISPEIAQFADVAQQGIGLLFLKFSRNHEAESDRLGVEYSTKTGYDADEMAGFFQTLDRLRQQAGADPTPTFLSTHPDPADREQRVRKLSAKWKQKLKRDNFETDREAYLQMINGMVYGDDPRQGFRERGVFYHPVLKFKFVTPSEWTFQNTPQQVQMASKDGGALLVLRLAPGNSLEQAAQTMLEQNQLNVVESRQVDVNGLNALAVVADQEQQQQQQNQGSIRTLTYFIQYDNNIYSLMGVSSTQNFSSFSDTFLNSMRSFSQLTDQSKINVSPEKISIQEAPESGTLAQVFAALGVDPDRRDELAILNGMELSSRVERGMLLKTISR
jgi:predicted Zn-dependent protease